MAKTTEYFMKFPDERTRKDFEASFKGWLTDWQRQDAILRRLVQSTATEEEKAAGLQAQEAANQEAGGDDTHRYGFDAEQGIIEIDEFHMETPWGPIDIGHLYLNIIPGW